MKLVRHIPPNPKYTLVFMLVVWLLIFMLSGCVTREACRREYPCPVQTVTERVQDTVYVPKEELDTIVRIDTTLQHDTITVNKDRLRIRYEKKHDTIRLSGTCDPDTIYREREVKVTKHDQRQTPPQKPTWLSQNWKWLTLTVAGVLTALTVLLWILKKLPL